MRHWHLSLVGLLVCLFLSACDAPPGRAGGSGNSLPLVGHWVLSKKESRLGRTNPDWSLPQFFGLHVGLRCIQIHGYWDGDCVLDVFPNHEIDAFTSSFFYRGEHAESVTDGDYTTTTFHEASNDQYQFHCMGFWLSFPQTSNAADNGYYGLIMTPYQGTYALLRFYLRNPVFTKNRMECDLHINGYLDGRAVFLRQGPPQGKQDYPFRDDDDSVQDMNAIEAELLQNPTKSKVEQSIRIQRNFLFGVHGDTGNINCYGLNEMFDTERKMYAAPAPAAQPAAPSPQSSSPAAPTSLPVQIGTIPGPPPANVQPVQPLQDHGYLGIVPIDSPRGIVVAKVISPGPAVLFLHEGDVIERINGIPIRRSVELLGILKFRPPGEIINLTILRPAGVKETISITLGHHP